MEYMPSSSWQTAGFFYSAGLGFCLGIIYDLFRILFYLLTGSDKKLSVVRDIIYLLICLYAVFIFLLVMCDGRLMFYAAAGCIGGSAIYFYTLSDFVYRPARLVLKKIRLRFLAINAFFAKISSKISFSLQKNWKMLDKKEKNQEKYLQIRHGIVYNHSVKLHSVKDSKNRGDESDKS